MYNSKTNISGLKHCLLYIYSMIRLVNFVGESNNSSIAYVCMKVHRGPAGILCLFMSIVEIITHSLGFMFVQ